MSDWLSVVTVIGGIITPIIVAVIGVRSEVATRNSKKAAKLEKKEKELEQQELKTQLENISTSITNTNNNLLDLKRQIDTLTEHDGLQDDMIEALTKSTRISGQYVHELAQLVMTLSEGMRDQHLDGNITKAISKYRKFESDTLNQFLTQPDK